MGGIASKMVHASLYPVINREPGQDVVFPKLSVIKGINMREEKLDFLDTRISDYLIKISRSELSERESKEVFALMNIVKELESIGDVIELLAEKLVQKKRSLKGDLSEEGKLELKEMHTFVCRESEQVAEALKSMDALQAERLLHGDDRFKRLVAQAEIAHLKRVVRLPEAEITHDIHMELINLLQQLHHYCKSIASSMLALGKSEQ
jgi:phosphate:Na+ symporter